MNTVLPPYIADVYLIPYVGGKDNRMLFEESQLVDPDYWLDRSISRLQPLLPAEFATAMIVSDAVLKFAEDGSRWLEAFPESMHLSAFVELPQVRSGIRGTGFLVTNRHLVTAAHVVDPATLDRAAFVFGVNASDLLPATDDGLPERFRIPAERVYYGKNIFVPGPVLAVDDIVVIELDSKISPDDKQPKLVPLAIAALDSLQGEQEVALVGHARLQPLTITAAKAASDNLPHVLSLGPRVIHTNIDSFQGNSGSALLDMAGDVLGVQMVIYGGDENSDSETIHVEATSLVASAVRMRVIGDYLKEIGATIRA